MNRCTLQRPIFGKSTTPFSTPDNLVGESKDKSIDGVLGRVRSQVEYDQIPNDPVQIGVAYAVAFLRGHCFLDGNKRTGLTALTTYLDLHQISLEIDGEYLADVMIAAAAGNITDQMLADLLYGYLSKLRID